MKLKIDELDRANNYATKTLHHFYFLLSATLLHTIFLYSIFDIYFSSPLLHGMPGHTANVRVPAKRLVLFVADGLRADKCFGNMSNTPYLRTVINNLGVWGVSHTRVPTESRPGHVAIIAGFYEDVSAVAKGWKENPVEFDSVFNQSRWTWSWGSPDILPMFAKGVLDGHVMTDSYPAEYEDFAGADIWTLDSWVFDKVHNFFKSAEVDEKLKSQLNEDKIIFFLHLLGLDTTGHRHNPSSTEYMTNIEYVDKGIENITNLINAYFGDNDTAFIMTADHGMSEWGTHGAGHPHETHTPLIAWGAGIALPVKEETTPMHVDWTLSMPKRIDIDQADIAPFMASLIGIQFPVNNVGMLNTELLNLKPKGKVELLYSNAMQILEQFVMSKSSKQQTTFSWLFRQFPAMSLSDMEQRKRNIRKLIHDEQFETAISESKKLITLGLEGIMYYHKYDRLFLGFCISVGFVSWMLYTLCVLLEHQRPTNHTKASSGTCAMWWMARIVISLGIMTQHLPWTYYVYSLAPTFPMERVARSNKLLSQFIKRVHFDKNLISCLIIITGLELMVFSFFWRELLAVTMLLLAATQYRHVWWVGNCLLLAIFPLLPVVGRGANYLLVFSCGSFVVIAVFVYWWRRGSNWNFVQVVLLVAGLLDVYFATSSIGRDQGLPIMCQITSFVIFISACVIPLLTSKQITTRLITVNIAIFSLYLLLSTSYEAWFLLSLSSFLFTWLNLENEMEHQSSLLSKKAKLCQSVLHTCTLEDCRRSFIYLLIIILAFFGTGNIASINSFEPASVYCFLTVFSPFKMGALMLLKILLPFILVACCFYAITSITGMHKEESFLVILLMSDWMGLHFFMWVQDSGSWLDIGTSISHYVIALTTTIMLIILSSLSSLLMETELLQSPGQRNKSA